MTCTVTSQGRHALAFRQSWRRPVDGEGMQLGRECSRTFIECETWGYIGVIDSRIRHIRRLPDLAVVQYQNDPKPQGSAWHVQHESDMKLWNTTINTKRQIRFCYSTFPDCWTMYSWIIHTVATVVSFLEMFHKSDDILCGSSSVPLHPCTYNQTQRAKEVVSCSTRRKRWALSYMGLNKNQDLSFPFGRPSQLHFSSICLKLFWTSPKFSQWSYEPWKSSTMLAHRASDQWNLLAWQENILL